MAAAGARPDPEKRVQLGRIVGVFGVAGWVKVESYTEPRARILKYLPWLIVRSGNRETEVTQVRGRMQGKGVVAALPQVEDRDAAMQWVGAEIWVRRSALPKPRRGEYYWADLEGLAVATAGGVALGRVSHLFSTGANDVMVVLDDGRERMIPFVPGRFVQDVDFDSGLIVVDWDPEF